MTKTKKRNNVFTLFAVAIMMMISLFASMLLSACSSKTTITLSEEAITLYIGDTKKLTATASNEDVEFSWSSENTNVATVRKGTVTAVGEGETTITATTDDGASASCKVTVSDRTVTISKTEATIDIEAADKTLQLTAAASDNGAITWNSSNTAVATVSQTGLVTAIDEGEATITAQRGTATATCKVTVTWANKPTDYYKLTSARNVEVTADPGVWHWFADGTKGTDYGFKDERTAPYFGNGEVKTTLSPVPDVANGNFFYFRYQPSKTTAGEDIASGTDTAKDAGEYYTLKGMITVSADCEVRLASKRIDLNTAADKTVAVTANTATEVEYVGYKNSAEPFSIRINTAITADEVSLGFKVTSIEKFVVSESNPLPEYHTSTPEKTETEWTKLDNSTETYNMEQKNNSGTVENAGTWYYWPGSGSTVKEATYTNGVIAFNFTTLTAAASSNNQLRFRPSGISGSTKFKAEFTITANEDVKVALDTCNSKTFKGEKKISEVVTKNGTKTISGEYTLDDLELIYIQVNSAKTENGTAIDASDVNVTVSDIKLYTGVEKKSEGGDDKGDTGETTTETALTVGRNSEVIANPGKWYYFCDGANGTDYVLNKATIDDKGTVVFAFDKMAEGTPAYQLRYQPNFATDTSYTATFTIKASAACRVVYGTDYKAFDLAADESKDVTWTGAVKASNPFLIQYRSTDRASASSITISNIAFTQNA